MTEPKFKSPYEAYGVECGIGWRGLYEPLIELCNAKKVTVLQVKEKFGTLRFYVGDVDIADNIHVLITAAEAYSSRTCEDCGEHGSRFSWDTIPGGTHVPKVTTGASKTSGWIRSLCGPCREAWDAKRQAEIDATKERMAKNATTEKSIPS